GGLHGARHGDGQLAAVEVVVPPHVVPADVGHNGNQPVIEHPAHEVGVDLLHPAGVQVIDAVDHAHRPCAHPVAHDAMRLVFGQQRKQRVGDVGGSQFHQGHGFGGG